MSNRLSKIALLFLCLVLTAGCATAPFRPDSEDAHFNELNVSINGATQYIQCRGRSSDLPILLILHGGPGWPLDSMSRALLKDLERDFVVVNWHQRGAGESYTREAVPGDMTLPQLLDDTEEVIRMLLKEYGQERLVLLGHSWGSVLGGITASEHPELLYAYIGVSQLARTRDAVRESQGQAIAQANKEGSRSRARTLSHLNPYCEENDHWYRDVVHLRDILTRMGGAIYGTGSYYPFVWYYLHDPLFSLGQKINHYGGIEFSIRNLYPEMLEVDLYQQAGSFEIPVLFIQGAHDMLIRPELAREYYEAVTAPSKSYYLFEESAHTPLMEEPENFCRIVRSDILPLISP